jgi:alkylation response protein AidB-like acyl-CoA dehydrogenase
MDFALSAEDRAFAERLRAFFTSEIPVGIRERVGRGEDATREDIVTSQRILNAHGLAVPNWPVDWGGQDWTPIQRHLWAEEMALAHVPGPLVFNTAMIGPVIANFGRQELKERFLPATANLDIWWAQGFSEPNAGSDLASLRTTAVRDGGEYVVNGSPGWRRRRRRWRCRSCAPSRARGRCRRGSPIRGRRCSSCAARNCSRTPASCWSTCSGPRRCPTAMRAASPT